MSKSIYIIGYLVLLSGIQANNSLAQDLSNLRVKKITVTEDTLVIDTLSVIPHSLTIYNQQGETIDTSSYMLLPARALLVWNMEHPSFSGIMQQELTLSYRVYPLLFSKSYNRKDPDRIEQEFAGTYNPFKYYGKSAEPGFFNLQSLSKSGSISRGISFGNNQDVIVNSSLNLQLSGMLSDDVEILAAITDNNIPFQPEGNTQQIQDFDKVFIQLSKNNTRLIAGDFDLLRPASYFMNFNKKGQGGMFSNIMPLKSKQGDTYAQWHSTVSASVSRGRYSRNNFFGQEGNQGPYRLTGANNETFITILSGSENVVIDGIKLVRGQENDYTIDYNTAEITFTPSTIITKDKRIIIEFQYSDRNYGRSLLFLNNELHFDKLKVKLNLYSEQDAKNQPLLQDLDEDAKRTLALAGDSLQLAVIPNIDSVEFSGEEVLYEKRDTVIAPNVYTIYIFSTDTAKAHYRLGFSNVGNNNGNYIQIKSSANGRVFEWLAPVNGIPQGNFEPVQQLIAPDKRQMATLGIDYEFSENTRLQTEVAYSNYDKNLFSSQDESDNMDYAFLLRFDHKDTLLKGKNKVWQYFTGVEFEHKNENFQQLEPFRNLEFTRDWNLTGTSSNQNDDALALKLGLISADGDLAEYRFRSFIRGDQYDGFMNQLRADYSTGKWKLALNTSLLNSKGLLSNTQFVKEKAGIERKFGKITAGIVQELEDNRILLKANDTLAVTSFGFNQIKAFIHNADTATTYFQIDYQRRYDYSPQNNKLSEASIADEASMTLRLQKNSNSRLSMNVMYRDLQIKDDRIVNNSLSDNTALGRLDYFFSLWKGSIQSNSYYQFGTGQEPKREFTYVEVPTGQGIYTWEDYNGNGIQELNEFELANFSDQANFVRVFTPTNEFIRTRNNQFNTVVNLSPAAASGTEGKFAFLKRFNDQLALRYDSKTVEENLAEALNPFFENVKDSALISANTSLRNTLFFNRTNAVFGADYTYQKTTNKTELVNGYEIRTRESSGINLRWNASKSITINSKTELGNNRSNSKFFSSRDYNIEYYSLLPKVSYQQGKNFRVSVSYERAQQKNNSGDVGEEATQDDFGIELKYSSVSKGIVTVRFNYIEIDFNASVNSPVAYEMLQGLNTGKNLTWNLSVLKNLSKTMQVNLNYDGRDTGGENIIHTGSVQVRAFF